MTSTPQNLSAEYDLEAPSQEPTQEPVRTPPRDPNTGQFVKPTSHPPRTVRMAKDLGFSDEEIAEMPTAELRQAVSEAAVERLYSQQAQTIGQAIDSSARGQAAPPATPGEQADDFSLKAEDYDEGLYGVVKKLWDRVKQLEASQAEFGQVAQHVRAQAEQTTVQQIDAEFGKFPSLFGKGGLADLPQDGPDMARRKAVVAYANSLKDGTPGQKVAKAIATLYPAASVPAREEAKPSRKAPPEADEVVERWLAGGVSAPTHRSGANEPSGPEKAAKTIAAYYRENGISASEPTIKDEFPE